MHLKKLRLHLLYFLVFVLFVHHDTYIPINSGVHKGKILLKLLNENVDVCVDEFFTFSSFYFFYLFIYSRTSKARTLMALYHGCFEFLLESLRTNPIVADLG